MMKSEDELLEELVYDHLKLLGFGIAVGVAASIGIFFFSASSVLLVNGNGTAPAVTEFTAWVMGFFGHPEVGGSIVIASLFAGTLVGAAVFLLLEVAHHVRRSA